MKLLIFLLLSTLALIGAEGEVITIEPSSQLVGVEGENAVLTCHFTNEDYVPDLFVKGEQGMLVFFNDPNRVSMQMGNGLISFTLLDLDAARDSDLEFLCASFRMFSSVVILMVNVPVRYNFSSNNGIIVFVEGTLETINLGLTAVPDPQFFTLYFNDEVLSEGNDITFNAESISFFPTALEHAGKYFLEASNGVGNDSVSFTLAVLCEEGSVRLNGSSPSKGRVLFCTDGELGTICDNGWDDRDAMVVCRDLGLIDDANAAVAIQGFGGGTGPIHLEGVSCSGTEYQLKDCAAGNDTGSCSHSQDAGVDCNPIMVRLTRTQISLSEGTPEDICVLVTNNPFDDGEIFTLSLSESKDRLAIDPPELIFNPGENWKCFEVEAVDDSTLDQTQVNGYSLNLNAVTPGVNVSINSPSIAVTVLDTEYVNIGIISNCSVMPGGMEITFCAVIEEDSAVNIQRPLILRKTGTATPDKEFAADAVATEIFQFPPGSCIGDRHCLTYQVYNSEKVEVSIKLELEAFDIAIVAQRANIFTCRVLPDPAATAPPTTGTPATMVTSTKPIPTMTPPTTGTPATMVTSTKPIPTMAPLTTEPTDPTPEPTPLPPARLLRFVNDTPIVDGTTVIFAIDSTAGSLSCRLSGTPFPCSVGENAVYDLEVGVRYFLRVTADDFGDNNVELVRRIYVPQTNECSVVLINDGITFDGAMLEMEFSGTGGATEFECRVESYYEPCMSPYMKIITNDELPISVTIRPTDCEENVVLISTMTPLTTEPTDPHTEPTPTIPERVLRFVTDTPIVDGTTVIFAIDSTAGSLSCRIAGTAFPCSVGENAVYDLEVGLRHVLRVTADDFGDNNVELVRRIYVPQTNECSVVLINDGITFDGAMLEMEFSGTGGATEFECRVESYYEPCMSPYMKIITNDDLPNSVRIRPTDCEENVVLSFRISSFL